MALSNRVRGEVALDVNGAPRTLCVTLGALAQLEAAFDVASIAELGQRLSTLTASDLIVVLAALMENATPTEITASRIDPKAAALAVAEAFRLAFDDAA